MNLARWVTSQRTVSPFEKLYRSRYFPLASDFTSIGGEPNNDDVRDWTGAGFGSVASLFVWGFAAGSGVGAASGCGTVVFTVGAVSPSRRGCGGVGIGAVASVFGGAVVLGAVGLAAGRGAGRRTLRGGAAS